MKPLLSIAVYDNDECFIALLKGYCYANNIAMTEFDFNNNGVNELEKINPTLIIVPLDLVSILNKSLKTSSLRQASVCNELKICAVNKNPTGNVAARKSGRADIIINNALDISEIDGYFKKNFLLNRRSLTERRMIRERRLLADRRNFEIHNIGDNVYQVTRNSECQYKAGNPEVQDFKIDHRARCVLLKGQKVNLTLKEFELAELLLTDVDRVFTNDEIINHLWPDSNRATKSDLYQYVHLLRKKIEQDPNNPQWIITVKGYGYKLNIVSSEGCASMQCLASG